MQKVAPLLFLSLLLLVGCQSGTQKANNTNYPGVSPLENQLGSAAQSVSNSLRTLAKTQQNDGAISVLETAPLVTPEGGMGGLVMLDWAGPIEPLLQKIARLTDYHLKILGVSPTPPILVSILAEERVVADILKDAALQAGKQANIVVYTRVKVIELRYLPSV